MAVKIWGWPGESCLPPGDQQGGEGSWGLEGLLGEAPNISHTLGPGECPEVPNLVLHPPGLLLPSQGFLWTSGSPVLGEFCERGEEIKPGCPRENPQNLSNEELLGVSLPTWEGLLRPWAKPFTLWDYLWPPGPPSPFSRSLLYCGALLVLLDSPLFPSWALYHPGHSFALPPLRPLHPPGLPFIL